MEKIRWKFPLFLGTIRDNHIKKIKPNERNIKTRKNCGNRPVYPLDFFVAHSIHCLHQSQGGSKCDTNFMVGLVYFMHFYNRFNARTRACTDGKKIQYQNHRHNPLAYWRVGSIRKASRKTFGRISGCLGWTLGKYCLGSYNQLVHHPTQYFGANGFPIVKWGQLE